MNGRIIKQKFRLKKYRKGAEVANKIPKFAAPRLCGSNKHLTINYTTLNVFIIDN